VNFYLLMDLRGSTKPGISWKCHVDYSWKVKDLLSTPHISRLRPVLVTEEVDDIRLYELTLHRGLPSLLVTVRVLPRSRGVKIFGGAPSNTEECLKLFELVGRTFTWLNRSGPMKGLPPPPWPYPDTVHEECRGDPCGWLTRMFQQLSPLLDEMGLNVDLNVVIGRIEQARYSLGRFSPIMTSSTIGVDHPWMISPMDP
jgi:hypothetical protein